MTSLTTKRDPQVYLRQEARRRRPDLGFLFIALVTGVMFLAVISGGVFAAVQSFQVKDYSYCTVSDKNRTSDKDGASIHRVYTDECGVFEVSDSLLSWDWSSADRYNSIRVGETHNFKARGIRLPFFSSFPNIVEAERVEDFR